MQGKPNQIPELKVQDLSKFGTWVKGDKIEQKTDVTVEDGTEVIFGSPKSIFM